jgi:hypothetical protein
MTKKKLTGFKETFLFYWNQSQFKWGIAGIPIAALLAPLAVKLADYHAYGQWMPWNWASTFLIGGFYFGLFLPAMWFFRNNA